MSPRQRRSLLAVDGMKQCAHCRQVQPEDAFWRNRTMPDGRHYTCKECFKSRSTFRYPEDEEPSAYEWDGTSQYSKPPPLQSVYNAVCLQAGHNNGTWSLTTAQAAYVRFMGLKRCAVCNGWCELQEDSDGLRGAGVQRHESPGKARTGVQAA